MKQKKDFQIPNNLFQFVFFLQIFNFKFALLHFSPDLTDKKFSWLTSSEVRFPVSASLSDRPGLSPEASRASPPTALPEWPIRPRGCNPPGQFGATWRGKNPEGAPKENVGCTMKWSCLLLCHFFQWQVRDITKYHGFVHLGLLWENSSSLHTWVNKAITVILVYLLLKGEQHNVA